MARTSAKTNNDKTANIHDQKLVRGTGGELHQTAESNTEILTTAQGGPVADDQNTLKIGDRGPTLIEDFHFREKIFHFGRPYSERSTAASAPSLSPTLFVVRPTKPTMRQ